MEEYHLIQSQRSAIIIDKFIQIGFIGIDTVKRLIVFTGNINDNEEKDDYQDSGDLFHSFKILSG